jgi:hypothetical protein
LLLFGREFCQTSPSLCINLDVKPVNNAIYYL